MKKTVLITGSSSGFGTNLAQAFAAAGCTIILHGRSKEKLRTIKNEITKNKGVRCISVVADLQTKRGLDVIRPLFYEYDVDILVNNAGINPELNKSATGNMEDINAIITINTSSAIALCYEAFAHFTKQRKAGVIININSVAGLRGSDREAVYAASKFGLRGFSESVKEMWLKEGIKMTDIYSGALATGMSAKRPDKDELISPQEIAEFIVKLCSTKSFFVRELDVQRVKMRDNSKVEKRTKTEYYEGI